MSRHRSSSRDSQGPSAGGQGRGNLAAGGSAVGACGGSGVPAESPRLRADHAGRHCLHR